MSRTKQAATDHEVHSLIKLRWSPYSYTDRPVSDDDLRSLFEAARWAASCFNEQPWHYILATKDRPEEFEKLLSCLVEANQAWARNAFALVLGVASTRFGRNDKPNRHALHDLGQASAGVALEATARGISVHQMGGILPDRAIELYEIPEGYEVMTAIAIGYAVSDHTDAGFNERDDLPRKRRPITEFVHGSTWSDPHGLVRTQ